MIDEKIVVFFDVENSTEYYEKFGTLAACNIITRNIDSIANLVQKKHGVVIKKMGDGLLCVFEKSAHAIEYLVELRKAQDDFSLKFQDVERVNFRTGAAVGAVEMREGDCFGDTVNVAARLCELCSSGGLWVTNTLMRASHLPEDCHSRFLGPIVVKGRIEPCSVYQIEWETDFSRSAAYTVQVATSEHHSNLNEQSVVLKLCYQERCHEYQVADFPISVGRSNESQFQIKLSTVSRRHLRLEWKSGCVVAVDASTFGSWVHFSSSTNAKIQLRHSECVLYGDGVLVLGSGADSHHLAKLFFSIV